MSERTTLKLELIAKRPPIDCIERFRVLLLYKVRHARDFYRRRDFALGDDSLERHFLGCLD